jgi:spermidine/putrescine transport system substrate-binding protein
VNELLAKQQPHVLRYAALVPNESDSIVTSNEVLAAAAFNGDALVLKQYQPNLEYVVPEDGGGFWMDFFVIMRNSRNQEAAYRFLDFINRPEMAAKNALFLKYATPNEGARKRLPKEFLKNKIIFPDEATLARCHPRKHLPSWVNAQVRNVVSEVVPPEKAP